MIPFHFKSLDGEFADKDTEETDFEEFVKSLTGDNLSLSAVD